MKGKRILHNIPKLTSLTRTPKCSNFGHLNNFQSQKQQQKVFWSFREIIASKWDESKGVDGNLNSEKNQAICHLGLGRS